MLVPCTMSAACSCHAGSPRWELFAFGKDGEDLLADPSLPSYGRQNGAPAGRIRLSLRQSRSVLSCISEQIALDLQGVLAGLLFYLRVRPPPFKKARSGATLLHAREKSRQE